MFGYRTITIAAPICAPARNHIASISGVLKRYEFKLPLIWHGGSAKDDAGHECYNLIHIAVHDAAANWCEYLLCRAGWNLESAPINPKNLEYAKRWQESTARRNGWYDVNHTGLKLPAGAVIGVTGEARINPNMPPAWQDQPRQPGGGQRRRKSAPEPTQGKVGIGKALKEWFS